MPSAQVINLNPTPRTKTTPLEKTLAAFSERHTENRRQQEESDVLSSIYKQYQEDGQNLQNTIMEVQKRPGLSPTTRVNTINQLIGFAKHNAELQKKVKTDFDKAENLKNATKALEEGGATPQQINLYKAAPQGGQTEIIKNVVETNQRNNAPGSYVPEGVKDFDSGLTPKERIKRQESRYTHQLPLVEANSKSLAASESEAMSLDLLQELDRSGKVGTGLHRLNINPKTGDLFLPAAASPEEQLFVKTVNDFTVKAKDSFGARVTNFELDRFMQRLPTLANSVEGRGLIMRQMSIVNKINQMERKSLQEVFDEYGVRNIDYADAENIARKKINEDKEALRKEYLQVEKLAKEQDVEYIKKYKAATQSGYTAMKTPSGQIKQFPTKNLENLKNKGYTEL
jgi:hypothetical protein